MIAYFKCKCTAKDRLQIKAMVDKGYEIRIVSKNPNFRKEVKQYGLPLPFVVNKKGKARPL